MGMSEYKAGMRLEILALDLQNETGAKALPSLIQAALRVADTTNFTILARIFPKTHQELMLMLNSLSHSKMDFDLVKIAKLAVRYRQELGIGIQLYEISTEIANALGADVDDVHATLSNNYNEIILRNE